MKYFVSTVALFSIIPGILSLTINTPTSVVQCQPQLLSWSGGAPPYYLSIIPGGQASAAPLKSFDTQTGSSLTWIVDLPSGTSITCALKDSTGATAYTDMVTIQPGTDSSCAGGSSNAQSTSVDSSNSGTGASNSGSSNSAPAAPDSGSGSGSGVATQAADATSVAAGSSGTASSRASIVGAGAGGATTARGTTSVGVPVQTQSRAVASTSASSARPSATGTSGAESMLSGSGLGFAGFVALAGALFL